MLRKKISILYLVWILLSGASVAVWLFSLGSLDVCLYDAKSETNWCLSKGSFCVESGISFDPLPEHRFELSHSFEGSAVTQPDFTIPLWLPVFGILLSLPLFKGVQHFLKNRSDRRNAHNHSGGLHDLDNNSTSDPNADARSQAGSGTDVSLPCPECHYDLRGLPSGRCPECNAEFIRDNLRPLQEGLVLERWLDHVSTWGQHLLFPWRVAFSTVAAFRRECPIKHVLTHSPVRYFLCLIVAFVILALAGNTITYTVDRICGIYTVFSDQHSTPDWRHCSLCLLPVHLPILWLQSLTVCLLGALVGWRMLSGRQIFYLATWLSGLGLLAGCIATLYEVAWEAILGEWLASAIYPISPFWSGEVQFVAIDLMTRSSDLLFGFLAGLAVGTVMGRRRWLLAFLAAWILYAGFPLYMQGQYGYYRQLPRSIRSTLFNVPVPSPDLSNGPTFDPDETDPSLAGCWDVDCPTGQDMTIIKILIDTTGRLTHFQVYVPEDNQKYLFNANGEFQEITVNSSSGYPAKTKHRSFGSCFREGTTVVIHIRLELPISTYGKKDILNIHEYTFSGIYNEETGTIEGTNFVVLDTSFSALHYPRREYSFTMQRRPAIKINESEPLP